MTRTFEREPEAGRRRSNPCSSIGKHHELHVKRACLLACGRVPRYEGIPRFPQPSAPGSPVRRARGCGEYESPHCVRILRAPHTGNRPVRLASAQHPLALPMGKIQPSVRTKKRSLQSPCRPRDYGRCSGFPPARPTTTSTSTRCSLCWMTCSWSSSST